MARPRKLPGYYDERRGLWCHEIDLGVDERGRRKRKRITATRRADLPAKIRAVENKIDAGIPIVDQSRTVRGWCEQYATEIAPYGKAAKSARNHADVLRTYVYPYPIARKHLATITPADVRCWMRQLETVDAKHLRDGQRVKLSPGTIGKARQVLSAAFTAAVRDEVLTRNVVQLTDPPEGAAVRRTGDALTVDEVDAVLAAAAERPTFRPGTAEPTGESRPDRLEALAVLVLAVGLRQAECLDLRWSSGVDLERRTVTVVDAKTPAGARTVPLPVFVVDALREHKRRQRIERAASAVWGDPDLVFASTVGTRIGARNALRWWHELTVRAGIGRRRFHAARHTAATVMLNRGVALELVSAILGHASYAITSDIYARPDVELLRSASDVLDRTYAR